MLVVAATGVGLLCLSSAKRWGGHNRLRELIAMQDVVFCNTANYRR
jgi:hypothetical protein